MIVGLDLGASEFRSLYHAGDRLQLRRLRSVYATLEDTPAQRRLLQQSATPYSRCQDHLIVVGTAAEEIAHLVRAELRPLLPAGRIPQSDPLGRQLLVAGLEAALPVVNAPGLCSWSCAGVEQGPDAAAGREFIDQVLRLKGYTPLGITAGEALLLAELGRDAFTGCSLSLGASHCSATLCLQGQPVWSHCVDQGGDWLDEEMARFTERYCWDQAGRQLLDVAAIQRWREGVIPGGKLFETPEYSLLHDLCRELLERVLGECAASLKRSALLLESCPPVCLVVGGGLARIPGMREWLTDCLSQLEWPLEFTGIRVGSSAPETQARGCLIRANLESSAATQYAA